MVAAVFTHLLGSGCLLDSPVAFLSGRAAAPLMGSIFPFWSGKGTIMLMMQVWPERGTIDSSLVLTSFSPHSASFEVGRGIRDPAGTD